MSLKQFVREPALLIDFAETLLVALIAFGLPVSGDQQSYIVAALVALAGLIKAIAVRPFAPAALTDFGRAALVVVASFGVGLTADQIAILVTLLGTVTTLVLRAQVTPRYDPVVKVGGAGAGPVAGEAGAALLGLVGAVLLVFALIAFLLTVTGYWLVGWPIIIVTAVVGVVLLYLDRNPGVRGRF